MDGPGRIVFDSLKLNLLALPICFLAVWGLSRAPLFRVMLFAFCQIPFHEMGHAVAAWLCGRWAFPVGAIIPFVAYTYGGHERSWSFFLVFQGALLWLSMMFARLGLGSLRWLPLAVGGVAIGMTWMMPVEKGKMLFLYGGIGGEFVLSTLLICLFYYRLPYCLRWDFFRFPALIFGVSCFSSAFEMWREIQAGTRPLPRGTMLVGRTDSNGDIDRLLSEFQWTEPELIANLNRLGVLCGIIILAHYGVAVLRSQRRS